MNRTLFIRLLQQSVLCLVLPVLAIVAASACEADPLKAEARGVYYLTPVEGVRRTNLASLDAWDNPSVVGVAIRVAWSELQRSPDQFDWSYLDEAIRIAGTEKKFVAISVIAGIYSPNWVLGSVSLLQLTGRDAKRSRTAPAPWDQKYLGAWKTFVEAFGARYDGNPAIGYVTATGPGRAEEGYVVDDPQDAAQFDTNKWVAAAREIVGYYNAAFKTTPWVLAWGKPSLRLNQLMADIYDVPGNFGFKADSLSRFFPNTSVQEGQISLKMSKTRPVVFQGLRPVKDPNELAAVLANGQTMGMQAFECYQGDARNPAGQEVLARANQAMRAH
jgi:hypothetical protein